MVATADIVNGSPVVTGLTNRPAGSSKMNVNEY
jgi:hypothetical protein